MRKKITLIHKIDFSDVPNELPLRPLNRSKFFMPDLLFTQIYFGEFIFYNGTPCYSVFRK